eukprot:2866925-Rhodomonas_salina.2
MHGAQQALALRHWRGFSQFAPDTRKQRQPQTGPRHGSEQKQSVSGHDDIIQSKSKASGDDGPHSCG